ncbi:MAG: intradiol ring-cleavage dioxygenase [Nakamurella sp.]
MKFPLPDQTPRGPAYEGRLLPRPEDEVVDQGLSFDVSTLLNRRRMFRVLGLGAGALALAACGTDTATSSPSTAATTGSSAAAASSSAASSSADTSASASTGDLTEIPDETAGPYPGDGSNGPDVLERSGIVRQDIRSSFGDSTTTAEGVPLTFDLTILDLANGGDGFAGVAVYAWHCDRSGSYSMYSDGITGENYLRGVQIADADGKVSFTSIVPACYSGRWPHIHFEVYPDQASITDSTKAIATSQMALPKSMCDNVFATTGYEQSVSNLAQITLASDNVFGDDSGVHQIGTVTGDVSKGYTASLTVPIDTATTPTTGSPPGGGGGGGTPPSGSPAAPTKLLKRKVRGRAWQEPVTSGGQPDHPGRFTADQVGLAVAGHGHRRGTHQIHPHPRPGTDPDVPQRAEQFRIAVADPDHLPGVAALAFQQRPGGGLPDGAVGVGDRISVRVDVRVPQAFIDGIEQPVGDGMFEHLGFVVHLVPAVAHLAHQPGLDQTMTSQHLQRVPRTGSRQSDRAVGLVDHQVPGGQLLHHLRDS